MICEFIERTKYEPTIEEYRYIEDSYYESECIDKNEFCKQWLKDKKCGKWDLEYKYRKLLDQQKAEYEEKLKEKENDLDFYRKEFKKGFDAQMKLAKIENIFK